MHAHKAGLAGSVDQSVAGTNSPGKHPRVYISAKPLSARDQSYIHQKVYIALCVRKSYLNYYARYILKLIYLLFPFSNHGYRPLLQLEAAAYIAEKISSKRR